MRRASASRSLLGLDLASGCSLITFVLALIAIGSPFWLVGKVDLAEPSTTVGVETIPTLTDASIGSFILVRANAPKPVIKEWYLGHWSYWETIRDAAKPCSNSSESNFLFENWSGKYGFCDKVDGNFGIPLTIRLVQAFAGLLAFFALFTVLAASSARKLRLGSPSARHASLMSFIATICAIVAGAQFATWQWVSDLRYGRGYIPLYRTIAQPGNATAPEALILRAVKAEVMYYGTSFAFVCCIAIAGVFISLTFLAVSKHCDDDGLSSDGQSGGYVDLLWPSPGVAGGTSDGGSRKQVKHVDFSDVKDDDETVRLLGQEVAQG